MPHDLTEELPRDLEAEKCALASLMLAGEDGKAVFLETRGLLSQDAFFQPDHQVIYSAVCSMEDAGRPIDGVTVCAELAGIGMLDDIGGRAYVAEIFNAVPSYRHGPQYARIVRDCATRRGLIRSAENVIQRAYGRNDPGRRALPNVRRTSRGLRLSRCIPNPKLGQTGRPSRRRRA